jgi:hypothetical protein
VLAVIERPSLATFEQVSKRTPPAVALVVALTNLLSAFLDAGYRLRDHALAG